MRSASSIRSDRGRRHDAAATRDALLAAGTELFADRGYDGVPVSAIAQKAGVNKAMINYHFGGKRKLYLTIVSATFGDIVGSVERLADSPRPAPEVLRELIAVVGEMVTRRHPHFCTMMLREVVAGGKHLEPELIDKPVRMLDAVQRIVARGVREGDFRPVDPLLTHLSLVGSLVFEGRARDPLVIAGVVALVGAIGLAACTIAAKLGLRINPAAALRDE